jgi:hypothetical protein
VNIAEGCAPSNINNAIRTVMAQMRTAIATALDGFLAGAAPLPVPNGGTGVTSAAAALVALGAAARGANSDITALTGLITPLSVSRGGTGATEAAAALAALGGLGVTASALTSPGYMKLSNGFIIQWGTGTATGNTTTGVTYPTAFTTFSIPVVSGNSSDLGAQDNGPAVTAATTTGCTVTNAYVSDIPFWWIAVGV